MTGLTLIQLYDDFFVKEYKYLRGFARSIDPRHDYESLLQDCYIKCRQRITASGFTGTTFLNFVRVSLMNRYKTQYRDRKYHVDSDDHQEEIEQVLMDEDTYQEQLRERDHTVEYVNTMAYEYVDRYCTSRDAAIFRTYYLLKHKHLNYKQLSEATGYSITSVSNSIKRTKNDLRINLKCYICMGKRIDELNEKEQEQLTI